jgi:hypothetical protein
MPFDASAAGALVDEIGRYHITDRAMGRAHERFATLLKDGAATDADLAAYLRAVRHYFDGFEREARAHLSDVEKRLAKAAQVQFNLTAERGVAARRVAATQGVLAKAAELTAT